MPARIALPDACGLTSKSAQVVEFGPADATSLNKVDVIDDRSVKWENSFDTNAEARFSNGDRFTSAAMFASNHDTFKSLQSFFSFRFFDPYVDADRVAWLKLWNVIPQLSLFNVIQSIHFSMLLNFNSLFQQIRTFALCFRYRCFFTPPRYLCMIAA